MTTKNIVLKKYRANLISKLFDYLTQKKEKYYIMMASKRQNNSYEQKKNFFLSKRT